MRIIFSILLIFALLGCRHSEIIDIVHNDTVYISRQDTYIYKIRDVEYVLEKDSLSHVEFTKGDTVFVKDTKVIYRDRSVDSSKEESRTSKDSIKTVVKTKEVNVPIPCEKKLSIWQKLQIRMCRLFLLGFLFYVMFRLNLINKIVQFIRKLL